VVPKASGYEELIERGVSEGDILRFLIVPENIAATECERLYVTPCGVDVSDDLARLVAERNDLILTRFPHGELWKALQPEPIRMVWYARRGGTGFWTLVDAKYRSRWLKTVPCEGLDERGVAAWLASELGMSVEDLERVATGSLSGDGQIEAIQLPTRFDHPQLYDDPWSDLGIANDREELYTRKTFPMIPWGHLHFLNRFYEPLLKAR
jgi:hypothetical protein